MSREQLFPEMLTPRDCERLAYYERRAAAATEGLSKIVGRDKSGKKTQRFDPKLREEDYDLLLGARHAVLWMAAKLREQNSTIYSLCAEIMELRAQAEEADAFTHLYGGEAGCPFTPAMEAVEEADPPTFWHGGLPGEINKA